MAKSQDFQIFQIVLVLALVLLLLEVDGVCSGKGRRKGNKPDDKCSTKKAILLFSKTLSEPHVQISATHKRSLSPWENIITRDASQIPKDISEARCLKKGCVGPDGVEDLGLESIPIQHEVLALKRVKCRQRSKILYQPSLKVITVGCTCVRPNVVKHD